MTRLYFIYMIGLLISLSFSANHSHAKDTTITARQVQAYNNTLAKTLNQKNMDIENTLNILHQAIAEDARFLMTIDNPTLPETARQKPLAFSKTDFINSFVQGTNYIDHYRIDITSQDIEPHPEDGYVISHDLYVERGTMKNPHNPSEKGRDFVSRTTCQTVFTKDGGKLIADGGTCHTDMSFEESI